MQTINTQLKLIEYLGENPLNISNLPGLLNLKKLGTFFSNSVITWVQGDPPMFQGFSSLLRESGYYVLSQGSLPYTLHNETEVIPSPKNVVSTLQIVSWKCHNKLIADMDSSFFNGVSKIGKLSNNSFTTWQPGIPDMFQGFLSFEKDETYLILSNPSGLPYQLYHCDPCAYEVCKDFYDWWMAGMTLNFSWDMGTTLWNDKPHAGTRWSGTASEVKPAGQQNFSLFRTATINTVDFLLRIDINVFINNGKYYFNYNEFAQGVPPNQEFVDGIRMTGGNDICDSGFNWISFNVFGYNFYWYPTTDMDGYITTTPSIAPPVCSPPPSLPDTASMTAIYNDQVMIDWYFYINTASYLTNGKQYNFTNVLNSGTGAEIIIEPIIVDGIYKYKVDVSISLGAPDQCFILGCGNSNYCSCGGTEIFSVVHAFGSAIVDVQNINSFKLPVSGKWNNDGNDFSFEANISVT